MSSFAFAAPAWGLALWAVAALVLLLLRLDARGRDALGTFLSPTMQARLVAAPSSSRRRASILLLGASLAFAVLALMRPQWGTRLVSTPRAGAEIMVCLDVSNSMLAEDVAPSRLERAKAEIRDLLPWLQGDSVGLIAFAGRATVLAPVTPDFSFLRLALDSAGPRSVSRGGTRLEEPIRKAVAGFGTAGTVSRSILLITDGEDQDSFPLEAAKEAAERGIKVLAIGFGDEAGSPIVVTDPKTGARKALRDASGKEVRSRLDGDTLRKIALATGGAYVPAGTGSLDLESIYRSHFAGLTRGQLDGQSRTIHDEAFQVAVLASLLCLVASVVVGSGIARPRRRATAALALVLAAAALAHPAQADEAARGAVAAAPGASPGSEAPPAQPSQGDPPAADAAQADDKAKVPQEGAAAPTRLPREAYNEALEKMDAGDLDAASTGLEDARARAGGDGRLRSHATYNLGIVEARRADAREASAPEEALSALERSASWFREAVEVDAHDEEARQNLELVLKRALVLADAIAKKNEKSLLDDLAKLVDEQRAFLAELRAAVQASEPQDEASAAGTALQGGKVRELAAAALARSTAAEEASDRALREQALLRAKPDDQLKPEDRLRIAQLDRVLEALHEAREQMGQARGRLRRSEGPGAYRAAANARTDLAEARDALLDPVRVLDLLLGEAVELSKLGGAKVALDTGEAVAPKQAWLTTDHLADTSNALAARAEELQQLLQAVLAQSVGQGSATANGSAGDQAQGAPDPQAEGLRVCVQEAEPHVGDAVSALREAGNKLEHADAHAALEPETRAVAALASARESFLDLARLLGVVHDAQALVHDLLAPGDGSAPRSEYAPTAATLQASNTARAPRLARALDDEVAKVQAAAAEQQAKAGADPDAAGGSDEAPQGATGPDKAQQDAAQQQAAEMQRLELARTYLQAARGALDEASRKTEALAREAAGQGEALPPAAWQPAADAAKEALDRVDDLRRLFFSVVDHLKELAAEQVTLGDRTEEAAGRAANEPDKDWSDQSGPLSARQQTLATRAQPLAEALRAQASQPPPPEAAGKAPADLPKRMEEAAQHVDQATARMNAAESSLQVSPSDFAAARAAQTGAVEELAEAIRLLSPESGQDKQDKQDKQGDQGQQGQQEQQGQQGDDGQQPSQGSQSKQGEKDQQPGQDPSGSAGQAQDKRDSGQAAGKDPAQLLQGIRDREAQRRANRDKAQHQGYEPVEKDW